MAETFTRWDEELPASTPKPEPVTPGMGVYSAYDTSMYRSDDPEEGALYRLSNEAPTDEERMAALVQLRRATVTYYEVPEEELGIDIFDPIDLPY